MFDDFDGNLRVHGRTTGALAPALSGDKTGARKAYQDFFALWQHADPDIPVLKQAKSEYAKLQ